jgi:hypothetical protein
MEVEMSSVMLGKNVSSMVKKTGMAIVESDDKFEHTSAFYRVPGNTLGDVYANLSIRKMSGRIIAFNPNNEHAVSNIYKIGQVIKEAELIEQGFKILTSNITRPDLIFVPSARPEPQFNPYESERLISAAKDPVGFFNHCINTSDEYVSTLNPEQLGQLFFEMGYTINDEIMHMILHLDMQDNATNHELNTENRSAIHLEFLKKLANIPSNLAVVTNHGPFVMNARQILIFDEHHQPNEKEPSLNEIDNLSIETTLSR